MGRRGGDAKMHGDTWRCKEAEWAVPPPQMVGKNWKNTSGVKDPSPTPDHPAQVPVPGR